MKNTLVSVALVAGTFAMTSACSDEGAGDSEPTIGTRDGACPMDQSVGAVVASLRDGYTSVQGKFSSSVAPFTTREVVTSEGLCSLLRPVSLFCDPSCIGATTCGVSGSCVDAPVGISLGDVSIRGLSNPVEMSARAPVFFYSHTGTLANPGFAEGDDIHMQTIALAGEAEFGLDVSGIAALELGQEMVELQDGVAIDLSWTAPVDSTQSEVHIVLNIAQHGGTPGSIECDVPDSGSFSIPVALSSQLLEAGFSGFPSLAVTRHSTDSAVVSTGENLMGCVEFTTESSVTLPVSIDGLISCSTGEDCPDGQFCGPDLSCQAL